MFNKLKFSLKMSARGTSSSKMPSPNGIIKVPGGPNPSQSVGWGQKAQKQGYLDKYTWTTPTNLPDEQKATDFPVVPIAPNEYDTAIEIKSQVARQQNNWMVPLSDLDVRWLLQKRDQMEKAEFDAWIGQKFDMTDPAQVALFKNIAPEYFERRKEVIESQVELQKRVALLKLTGITSMDDLQLAWAVETGRLKPVPVSVAAPGTWRAEVEPDQDAQDERYTSGLFSPIKWLTRANAGRKRVQGNTFAAINPSNNADQKYMTDMYSADGRESIWGERVPLPNVQDEIYDI